ncbi:MAG: hypothetical protein H0X37_11850 [Herpetosiphonaceae bacterium]|nr:hypothetical protein [Herpetosiphonaceae bacterium]
MFAILKQHRRHWLPLAALALTVALTGCGSSASASRATIISETAAASASDTTPTAAQPATSTVSQSVQTISTLMTSSPATAAPAAQSDPDPAGALDVVVNYYAAINQRDYERAYHAWANGGVASKQSLEQFKQGFAKTVQVNVQAGTPRQQANNTVDVPLTFQAVVNEPADATHDQKVQQFSGSYTLQPVGTTWQIASANISAASGGVKLPSEPSDPIQFVRAYYDAINRREFARAYTYWGNAGTMSKQTFTQFQQGFAATDHVVIDLGKPDGEGAAGSTFIDVPVVIVATNTNRTKQTFCGTYTLRHLNVPPFDQFGLHIEQAKIIPTTNVDPGSDQAKQLLNGGCK